MAKEKDKSKPKVVKMTDAEEKKKALESVFSVIEKEYGTGSIMKLGDANSAKMKYLGVKGKTLEKHGAVSYETAFEMAEGLRKNTGADVTVGITGIAGPTGGTKEKPVGLVYVGICVMGETEVKELHLNGTREEVRECTCKITFENIANRIENITKVQ